jgi:hypothetical protein
VVEFSLFRMIKAGVSAGVIYSGKAHPRLISAEKKHDLIYRAMYGFCK